MLDLFSDRIIQSDWWGKAGRLPNNSYSGTFFFSGRGGPLSLKLDGMFVNSITHSYTDSVMGPQTIQQGTVCYQLPVIFSEIDGIEASLVDCILRDGSEAASVYEGRLLILGSFKKSWHDLNYERARFSLSGVRATDIAKFLAAESKFFAIDEGARMVLNLDASFDELALFSIESSSKRHIEWFWSHMFWLQNLFSLLQGSACAIASQSMENSGAPVDQILFNKDRGSIQKIRGNELVPLSKMSQLEFEVMLTKWMRASEKLKAAVYHFNSAIQFASPKHQTNLINVSQALEAFHREIFPDERGLYIPENDYEKLKTEVSDLIGRELKVLTDHYCHNTPEAQEMRDLINSLKTSLIKGRIKFGNEKAQSRRLTEILRLLHKLVPELTEPLMDKKLDFVRKIIDTRNYYIHFSDPESKRLTEVSTPFAVMACESIFIASILVELGVNADLVKDSISTSARWRNFEHALSDWEHKFITIAQRHKEIEKIAHKKHVLRGYKHGFDKQDWFEAVREFEHP